MLIMFGNLGNEFAEWITGIRPYSEDGPIDFSVPGSNSAYRIASVFANVGGFLFGALLLAWFSSNNLSTYFHLKSPLKWKYTWVILVCFIVAIPVVQLLSVINEVIVGVNFSGIQDESSQLKSALLNTTDFSIVLLNLFTMALLPAIGEELFFRGVVLRVSYQGTKNLHLGVLFSAILFSVIHFEFEHILSISFMGILLGYLYVYTGSILAPIALHFLNNGVFILLEAYGRNSGLAHFFNDSAFSNAVLWTTLGLLSIALFILFLRRSINKERWPMMIGSLFRD
mgnify:CR=1 FL=1